MTEIWNRLDALYDDFDDLFYSGEFEVVNDYMKRIDVENEDLTFLIGVLTASNWAPDKLSYRKEFYKKVEKRVEHRKDKKELLMGLE